MSCLQYSMIATHLLTSLLGAMIMALGIWLKADKDFWSIQQNLEIKSFVAASTILIIVGVVTVVTGFWGCSGTIAGKIWILVAFSVIMIIILVLEIAVISLVWSTVSGKNKQEDVRLKTKSALQHLADDEKKRVFIDLIQRKLKCCGVDGPKDYSLPLEDSKPIPGSCTPADSTIPYGKGCYDAVVNFLKSKAAFVGGVTVAVLVLQLGVLVFTVFLVCIIHGIKYPATNCIC